MSDLSPQIGPKRTLIRSLSPQRGLWSSGSRSGGYDRPPSPIVAPLQERRVAGLALGIVRPVRHDAPDAPHFLALLRPRRERPGGRRAADKADEVPPPHGAYPKAKDHGLSIAGQAVHRRKSGPLMPGPGQNRRSGTIPEHVRSTSVSGPRVTRPIWLFRANSSRHPTTTIGTAGLPVSANQEAPPHGRRLAHLSAMNCWLSGPASVATMPA